jgi:hypothetical protein
LREIADNIRFKMALARYTGPSAVWVRLCFFAQPHSQSSTQERQTMNASRFATLLACALFATFVVKAADTQPNVLILVSDDQG